jgi:hypothetical protein
MDPSQNPTNASGGPQRQQPPVYDINHGGHYGTLAPFQSCKTQVFHNLILMCSTGASASVRLSNHL